MSDTKRGEDVTEDGTACFAVWVDKDNGDRVYIGQGFEDRISLSRFHAVVLGKYLQGLEVVKEAA